MFTKAQQADWTLPSWDELVREYSPMVFRLSLRLTGDRYDAEDLTQEVFIRAFRNIHTFTPGTIEGWLHRITTNLFLDQARRRQRVRFHPVGEATDRIGGDEASPDDLLDDAMLDADVARALADLAPEYRVAVVLCDVQGLSYDEIANVLDVKLGTVRSRIHRGRSQLRVALAHRRPTATHSRYLGMSEDLDSAGQVVGIAASR